VENIEFILRYYYMAKALSVLILFTSIMILSWYITFITCTTWYLDKIQNMKIKYSSSNFLNEMQDAINRINYDYYWLGDYIS